MSWEFWFLFPIAIVVCILATASGFSGSVLFQPILYFFLKVPLSQSIATGIATETIGMTNGAITYARMCDKTTSIDRKALRSVVPYVISGVAAGFIFFVYAPRSLLRMTVGLVITSIAIYQIYLAGENRLGGNDSTDLKVLARPFNTICQFLAGAFSASTGTGMAEVHQPLFEQRGGLSTLKANATAICIEAIADWSITLTNMKMGNLRYDILIFTVAGVLVGGQIGPRIAKYVHPRLTKIIFGISVTNIGAIYVVTSWTEVVKLYR
ncbi:sulfite exporter TauE/SafE family protein [Synechococcus sp. EJ6-Ellesmere]|uniref:sulfite exporter TauE/SafE family protein n=1 Tax=Synechococcus sp. EJ6-Ellesmere TaxID=2823734 RepID=UPI0020CBD534|nr:sulfite exporter TauE/SafE family protein [Synechococcus sp. EJ6-Ellesmere]MCP9823854.1 sulfite exporter TauE/SafE family protein [Synechococcus sp. EJ6-Ellesmere]